MRGGGTDFKVGEAGRESKRSTLIPWSLTFDSRPRERGRGAPDRRRGAEGRGEAEGKGNCL